MQRNLAGDVDSDLVQRASELRPLLAQHAATTESERKVVPEVIAALEAADLFEVIVPKRAGGLGATMATQLSVAAELARGCASTAWVQTLLNITTWATARDPAASHLFEEDPRPRVCGVIAPGGTATAISGGGYRVTGHWPFASGSFHANWFVGGVLLADESGTVGGVGMVRIPREDFEIDDTWFVAGMCGTASSTVVANDLFVPAECVTGLEEAASEHGEAPSDRWPMGSALSIVLMGPLLGAASACAEIVIDKAPKRSIAYTSYSTTPSSTVAVTEVARACLDIDTAWLHASEAAAYIDGVGRGAPRDGLEEARLRGRIGYLTASLRHGVDSLINVGGAGSFASASPLQRHWRDLNVGSRHAFLTTNVSLETYGRALFGLDPVVVMV